MDTLFGLPAHSLLIHAPIVLLPLMAIITVALAIKSTWRRRVHWWMVGGIFSIVVMLFLAKESGESFDEALDGAIDVSRHEDLANTTFIFTLLWLITYAALTGYEHAQRRNAIPSALTADANSTARLATIVGYGLAALTGVLAVLATIWLIRTGHEGADVVWGETTVFD